jgi:hypothetical protein
VRGGVLIRTWVLLHNGGFCNGCISTNVS